jgi:hypothetical protein
MTCRSHQLVRYKINRNVWKTWNGKIGYKLTVKMAEWQNRGVLQRSSGKFEVSIGKTEIRVGHSGKTDYRITVEMIEWKN